jgi:hypothetical protein
MTNQSINAQHVLEKHLHHPIEIIDKEVFVNSDPCHQGLVHAGRIMCKKCNVQIKWASYDEIEHYRNSTNKGYETSSFYNFIVATETSIIKKNEKAIHEEYYKKYCVPADGTYNVYLNVKFSEKNEVKKLGAKWDHEQKKWFVNSSNYKNIVKLQKWINPKDLLKLPIPDIQTK